MSVAREQPPVERIVGPFQDFAHKQSSGGILLIAVMAIALVWAKSPWDEGYTNLSHTNLTVGVSELSVSKNLTHWINDGLMAVFFLVVRLEIKREVLVGKLAQRLTALALSLVGVSIVAHGISVTPLMKRYEGRRKA